jgi:hypothetical protein
MTARRTENVPTAERRIDVGAQMEELLRAYFLAAGYFVVRGVKPVTNAEVITDLDLWLYLKPSPIGRERVNVDAKYKDRPKALERIVWAKGAQTILGLERCIVATTDKRPIVKEFGSRSGVLVLDGHFVARLNQQKGLQRDRIVEEDLIRLVDPRTDPSATEWRKRLNDARSRLVGRLDYGGCNLWLDDVCYFLNQSNTSNHRAVAVRLAYVTLAYFLIGLDYSTWSLAFEDGDARRRAIDAGLRYGDAGREYVANRLRMAVELIEQYTPESKALGAVVRRRVLEEIERMPVGALAGVLSKAEISHDLFSLACELETAAYRTNLVEPGTLSVKAQACLGAVLDFADIDRTEFYGRFE